MVPLVGPCDAIKRKIIPDAPVMSQLEVGYISRPEFIIMFNVVIFSELLFIVITSVWDSESFIQDSKSYNNATEFFSSPSFNHVLPPSSDFSARQYVWDFDIFSPHTTVLILWFTPHLYCVGLPEYSHTRLSQRIRLQRVVAADIVVGTINPGTGPAIILQNIYLVSESSCECLSPVMHSNANM